MHPILALALASAEEAVAKSRTKRNARIAAANAARAARGQEPQQDWGNQIPHDGLRNKSMGPRNAENRMLRAIAILGLDKTRPITLNARTMRLPATSRLPR